LIFIDIFIFAPFSLASAFADIDYITIFYADIVFSLIEAFTPLPLSQPPLAILITFADISLSFHTPFS